MTEDEAVKRYERIRRVVYGFLRKEFDRDGLVSEIFLWFLMSGKFVSNRMIKWRILDWIGKRHGEVLVDPMTIVDMVGVDVGDRTAWEREEYLGTLVRRAGLKDGDMDLLYQRFYLGMGLDEIALRDGRSVATVGVKLKSILGVLKESADDLDP